MDGRVDLVLVAGGRIEGEFAAAAGATVKALIRLEGRSVLERTLQACAATGRVRRAVLVGPEEVAADPCAGGADALVPERGNAFGNASAGLEWLHAHGGAAPHVLVAATDLPFITAAAVERFLAACPEETDLCLPVVEQEAFEACFPDLGRTFVPLREGAWKVGSAVLVRPATLLRNRAHFERIFAARKSPLALARLLGAGFLLRLLFRRLTVAQVERRVSGILGCRAAAVRDSAPELAFDLDHLQSYQSMLEWLRRGGERGYGERARA